MTAQEASNQLKELQKSSDAEYAHGMADDILCKLLRELGHEQVVNDYLAVEKWYA